MPRYRLWTIRGLLIAEAVRAASFATILFVSRHSFWMAMWVMGDVPHAVIAVLVAAVGFLIVVKWTPKALLWTLPRLRALPAGRNATYCACYDGK